MTPSALSKNVSFVISNCFYSGTKNLIRDYLRYSDTTKTRKRPCRINLPLIVNATARTITRTNLNDKVRTETVLWKAGLRSLTQAVSEIMACSIWKAQSEMNPLGHIYQKTEPVRNTRSSTSTKLCIPIPGHPEAATNKLAQVWNLMDLSSAKTVGNARALAKKWYSRNSTTIQ